MPERSFLSSLFRPRIDRILFAATKADHLHHLNHDRLEAIVAHMVKQAVERSESSGAAIDVVGLAAVRATREARVRRGREELPSIIGTPAAGESAGGTTFDGNTEAATFPGDLPDDHGGRRGKNSTSEVYIRNMLDAWLGYMTGDTGGTTSKATRASAMAEARA